MAVGTRQPNTMEELLRKQLSSTSDLFLADDADFDFITQLQANIVGKLRQPIDQMAGQGLTAAPPSLAGGAPGGDMGMGGGMPGMGSSVPLPSPSPVPGPPAAAMQQAMPQRGLQASPSMPNPDELRRMIEQG